MDINKIIKNMEHLHAYYSYKMPDDMDDDLLDATKLLRDMINIDTDALVASIQLHGKLKKEVVCMEECAELIQDVSKDIRGKLDRNNIIEEIADVLICIENLKIIHDISNKDINRWIADKINRQKERDAGNEV